MEELVQEKYSELEEYLRNVSHELKSPLQEISLYAKVIAEDCEGILPEQSARDLQEIREICSNTLNMVQLFMGYSRIRNSAIKREIISVSSLVKEIFERLTGPLTNRNISLYAEYLPDVIADSFLMEQMLQNILSNSIKFSSKREHAVIRVYSVCNEQSTDYCFEDNGIGFDDQYAGKIFDMFERMHSDRSYEGNGIGLALVKSIVDRMGGAISISSDEGNGCTVTVTVPNNIVITPQRQLIIEEEKKAKIKIGVLGAVSGDYSNIAPARRYAYELAAQEINAAGGINGKTVEILFKDFESDVSKVSELAWELVAIDRVDVLMGGQLSSAREFIREVADKTETPFFFNSLYEGGLADHFTFCCSSSPEQNVFPMIDYLLPLYGGKCYIIAADYNYGVLTAECVKDYIEKKGGIVAGIEYFGTDRNDFSTTIENIKRVAPDILFSFCVSSSQDNFYRSLYEDGVRGIPMVSTIGIGDSYMHRVNDPPCMNNTYFMGSYIEELDTPAAVRFTDAIRSSNAGMDIPYIEFDAEPAYTAVYLYKKAVEKAGCTDAEAVIAALESGEIFFDGPGGRVTVCGENHHMVRDEILFRVNAAHNVEKVARYPAMKTEFVQKALQQEMGCGSLKELGRDAPNMQYNMMFRRIV